MNPQIIGPLDSALKIAVANTNITTTTSEAAFDLLAGQTVATGLLPFENGGGIPFNILIPIVSYDATTGDESYAFKIQTSPDGSTWTDFSRIATVNGASTGTDNSGAANAMPAITPAGGGNLVIGFFARVRYLRLVETLGGTTPILNRGDCYLMPITNAIK